MFLTQPHHIAIICSDYDKAKEFYIHKLGFQLTREAWREDRQDWLWMIRKGDVVLELFIVPGAPRRPSDPEALGLRHLAFRVEDMEAAVEWLHSLGIDTEPVRQDKINGGRFTFFRDPDGLPLELHE